MRTGLTVSSIWIRSGWCFWTRPPLTPAWPADTAGRPVASGVASPSRLGIGKPQPKTTTVGAGLRTSGVCATTVLDGAMTGERFRAYVRDTLVPVLKPGDTVILDKLGAHKVAGVREAIEAAGGRLLYLPPYSPEFNPIERAFAKLTALLRTAAARTVNDLWAAIQRAFAAFRPDECRNYLAAAGYDACDPT